MEARGLIRAFPVLGGGVGEWGGILSRLVHEINTYSIERTTGIKRNRAWWWLGVGFP